VDDYNRGQIEGILDTLSWWLEGAYRLNENDKPTRSRELSLAITAAQEARHWLRDILDNQSEA
jgi:hypothetical protein